MRWLSTGLVALLLGAPALGAVDEPKEQPKGAAEEYQALLKEYEAAQQAFSEAYTKAKTDAERQRVLQEKYPEPNKFAPRFMKLAEESPNETAALEALLWICSNAPFSPQEEQALGVLLRYYVKSPKLVPVCDRLVYSQANSAETFLRAVLEKNPSHEVKGHACLALASRLKNSAGRAPAFVTGIRNLFTKPANQPSKDPQKEAEELFERTIKEFGDVQGFRGTLADSAKGQLYEIRFLAIGKEAPEIEGEDIDGKKFKLSDYRGKVVVLDFWGNW